MTGILYVVATPIGNLADITFRAVQTLRTVSMIAAEDTRHTRILLGKYEIKTAMISFHQYSDTRKILDLLEKGTDVALVSDAGTPGISDPGTRLVADCRQAGHPVVPVPGVSALVTALSASGLPTDRFTFFGFPPQKKGRQTFFKQLADIEHTVIFYESSHRIQKCAQSLSEMIPDRQIVFARELTKIHEEFLRGTPAQILEIFNATPEKMKGEFVVLVAGTSFRNQANTK